MKPFSELSKIRAVPALRHPKTHNEMVKNQLHGEDLEDLTSHQQTHLIRAKRKPFHLANEWDDKNVSLWKNKRFVLTWTTFKQLRRKSHFDTLSN